DDCDRREWNNYGRPKDYLLMRQMKPAAPEKRICRIRVSGVALAISIFLVSCAGSPHPRVASATDAERTSRYLEIDSELRAGTLHFPAGVYTLNSADKIGYYYRAPRKIAERTGHGSLWREGGIFVSKRNPQKMRGYIYRAGTITHVGNFSRAQHRFREEP